MAIISAWIISGAGVGIFALTIPFVVPAFRRHCLPYVPATPVQIERVLGYLRPGRMVDLGSGDGRVVIAAAKQGHYSVGYELNPWLVLFSKMKALLSGVHKSTEFHRKDLWKVNLSKYDNVVFFGVDDMMQPLGEKIAAEVSQDARVVACRFRFPSWEPRLKFEAGADSVWVYDDADRR